MSGQKLSQADRRELELFEAYLGEVASKPTHVVLAERQDYLDLSDEEVRVAWRQASQR
jgi:hypothetical protein